MTAKAQSGYIPQQTNKTLTLEGTGKNYNVIFYYTPEKNGSHTVNFVEAGTETKVNPTIVKTINVKADQTVVTPDAAAVKELSQSGYELVSKDTKGYKKVKDYQKLTWLDESGKPREVSTLAGGKIPDTVTYLVQPVKYTITYQNAAGSPEAAKNGLSAVTAAENTPVGSTQGKNPTQYTAKDSFILKNPARVYDNGKYYQFSHWSLGTGTTVKSKLRGGETYSTLTVDKGTVGKLTFIANWKEMPAKPDDPDTTSTESTKPTTPTESTKPITPTKSTKTTTSTKPSKSGSSTGASPKTGDEINMTLWLGLLGFSGIGMISILTTYVQRRKEKNNE